MRLRCYTEASEHSGYFFLQLLLSKNDACSIVLEKLCSQLRKDQEAFLSSLASFCCKEGEKKGKESESQCNSKVIFGHSLTQAGTASFQRKVMQQQPFARQKHKGHLFSQCSTQTNTFY